MKQRVNCMFVVVALKFEKKMVACILQHMPCPQFNSHFSKSRRLAFYSFPFWSTIFNNDAIYLQSFHAVFCYLSLSLSVTPYDIYDSPANEILKIKMQNVNIIATLESRIVWIWERKKNTSIVLRMSSTRLSMEALWFVSFAILYNTFLLIIIYGNMHIQNVGHSSEEVTKTQHFLKFMEKKIAYFVYQWNLCAINKLSWKYAIYNKFRFCCVMAFWLVYSMTGERQSMKNQYMHQDSSETFFIT